MHNRDTHHQFVTTVRELNSAHLFRTKLFGKVYCCRNNFQSEFISIKIKINARAPKWRNGFDDTIERRRVQWLPLVARGLRILMLLVCKWAKYIGCRGLRGAIRAGSGIDRREQMQNSWDHVVVVVARPTISKLTEVAVHDKTLYVVCRFWNVETTARDICISLRRVRTADGGRRRGIPQMSRWGQRSAREVPKYIPIISRWGLAGYREIAQNVGA